MAIAQNNRKAMSKDELDVMVFALRYAIGRFTYAPQIVCEYIASQLSRMESYQLDDILGEVEYMIYHHAYADDNAFGDILKLRREIKEARYGKD